MTTPFASGGRGSTVSSNDVSGSGRSVDVFYLCLTRRELDAEVLRTVEAFSLNPDQARLLWRCARWFRTSDATAAETSNGRRVDGEDTKGKGSPEVAGAAVAGGRVGAVVEKEKDEGTASPVVLVHGVFGESFASCSLGFEFFGIFWIPADVLEFFSQYGCCFKAPLYAAGRF